MGDRSSKQAKDSIEEMEEGNGWKFANLRFLGCPEEKESERQVVGAAEIAAAAAVAWGLSSAN